MRAIPIGQLLVEEKIITEEQLDLALEKQKETKQRLGEVIAELEFASERDILRTLGVRLSVEYVDSPIFMVEIDAVNIVAEQLARRYMILPMYLRSGTLTIATNDPLDFACLEDIAMITGLEVDTVLSPLSEIERGINRVYAQKTTEDIMGSIKDEYSASYIQPPKEQESDISLTERVDSAPIVKLVNSLILEAYQRNASDIHIEPEEKLTRIRFRIDGDLQIHNELTPEVHQLITTRIKIISGMNIAEKRIPQDGGFQFKNDFISVDLRVSSIPTPNGEKIVIRLLGADRNITYELHSLGLSDETIYDEHLQNHPFFKTMWDVEQHDLLMMRFQAAFPLKYNNNLIGMLLIGHGGNFAIQEAEARMLSTLCATASIAINNASMFLKFQEEATKDSLTALYNHRYFIDQMENFCDLKNSAPLSLIMINVDMFSMFNDIYGNQAGDKALIKIADAIKFVCGSMGVLIRYGGDMFAILLEKTDTYFAYEMAEKIRMRVENMSMADPDEVARHLTISIGLSVCPILAKDDKQLIEQANLALDIAKHSGRNKTIIYEPNQAKKDSHHAQPSEEMNMATIYALTAAIDAKDHYTFGHSQRVAKYASAIAQKAGASAEEVNTIRQAALLHDVGKIGIPEHILTKYSKLEDHEYETMKMHVDMSITIIKYLPSFSHVIPAVLGHHERWDGRGYPRQIAGENIAFGARCIGIADAFDAITSNRHYKTLLSVDYALEEIERNAGTQFDPHLAKIFVEMVRSGELIIEPSRTYEN